MSQPHITASPSTYNIPNGSKVKWTVKPFDHKLFIKNKGQFDNKTNTGNRVIYGAQIGKADAYFTTSGVVFRLKDKGEPIKKEGKGEEEEEESHKDIVIKYADLTWVGANPDVTIEAENKQSFPYIYPAGNSGSIYTSVFKKIIYRNLYPGIDVEYTFPKDKSGIKYVIIVHSGADLSAVKLKYANIDNINLNKKGDAIVATEIGAITDHAPVSFYRESYKKVNVSYILHGGEESFAVKGGYDKTKTLVIDPWTNTLPFGGSYNQGYDVDYDYQGNVYVQGSWGPVQLVKYNSAGTQQWVYNETTLNTTASACYGDFAVNRNNGECYCAEGDRETTTGAKVIKVNTNGSLMATWGGNVNYQEIWRIAYNSCTNMLVLAGGGTNATNQSAVLDTSFSSPTLKNVLGATNPYHDMTLLALDPNGAYCYEVSSQSCCYSEAGTNDQLVKLPLPGITPVTYKVNAPTAGSFPEDVQDVNYMTWSGTPTNGFNGAACSPNYLYTYDGASLYQQNKSNGSVVRSASPGTNQQSWGGLDVDACDNVYVGANNQVKVYNSSLGLTSTISASNTVYDLMLGQNYKTLYITGQGFLTSMAISNSTITTTNVTTAANCGSCNGTARADLYKCGAVDTTGASYLWSNGATTHTITGLCAGTYTVTITPAGLCQDKFADTVTVTSNSTLSVNVSAASPTICSGSSTTLTASGATNYSWGPTTGINPTTGSTVTANPTSTVTYTVTGTSGGCSGSATVTLTVNTPPTVTASAAPSDTICNGSSVTISAAGGASSYSWSPGGATGSSITVSPTTTTTYTVTGTTSGCSNTDSVQMVVKPLPTVTAIADPDSMCAGGSGAITANGANTYTWSPGGMTGAAITVSPSSTTTYTVTGTSTNGCSSTATVNMIVNPPPTVTALADPDSICIGGSAPITASGATSYSWSPGGMTGASITVSPTTTTTYTVTGVNTSGCVDSTTATMIVHPLPTVTATANPDTICSGSSITLTAGGANSYNWMPGSSSGSSLTVSPTSNTTYTVTGTSTSGCSDTASVAMIVNPTPTVTALANPDTICAGDSIAITANGANSYTWMPGGMTGASITVSPSSTTTYTITGTNTSGCSNSTTLTMTVKPPPTVTAMAAPDTICSGSSVTLSAGGATSYNWMPGNSTGSSLTVSPTSSTTYTVTGTTGGCSDTTSVTMTVNPTPVVTAATSDTAICQGDSIILTAGGATSYHWMPGNSTGSSLTVYPTSTTTYTVTGTTGNCIDSAKVATAVHPTPVVTASSSDTAICQGDSTTLTASGASTYSWMPGSMTGTTLTVQPTSTTTYTVTGTTGSCNDTTSVTMTVNPSPTVSVNTSANTICQGDSVTLTAGGSASSYNWNPGPMTGSSVTVSPTSTTTYTLTGTIGSCSDSTTVTTTVNPTPTVTASSADTTICAGSTDTLIANGAANYSWMPSGSVGCSTCGITPANPTTTTTYTVTGTSAAGCPDTAAVTVNVNAIPNVTISSSGGDSICAGQNVILTANSSSGTYQWSTGATTDTINPSSSGTYTVIAMNGNCKDSATQNIYLYPPMVVSMTGDSVCSGNAASVSVSVSGGKPGYTYTWNNGLGNGPGPYAVNPTTPTYYTCSVSDACGSAYNDSVEVYTFPSANVGFTVSPDTILAGQYVAFINNSVNATSYYWNLGDGNSSTDTLFNYQYTVPGTYVVYLIGTNAYNCADTARDTIYVDQNIMVPNIFTPNGDGQNDVFHVTAGGLRTYYIEIYNRWGERVFRAESPNIDWDGKSTAGVPESDGTYYYIIKATGYNNKKYDLYGYLELVR